MKNKVSIEFCGKDMEEIIGKVVAFLNMFKGIQLGGNRNDNAGKGGMAEESAK